ncbi:small subunit rRNA maturation protein UTP4 NDAI_0C04390 [Naumovozyma dairenensis CBS 421]|uniref:Uncharacterized protein n=1 Tax=Naumovozyma dairenensis (strain ATCC 10597 / BCRC 20456 / CBS 421 / NBRC 0211 / NRRL Y-12639) TaxID=1071378 RepID=G0W8I8_NAUDC|nr:hypothetical protein NDAI_0C04390 [Naumovozyma dairenensis CBS 421]CCD24099.1 hypothetical protein NDAI_0C04390 [Naumovozyma dairenensis CBS 421]
MESNISVHTTTIMTEEETNHTTMTNSHQELLVHRSRFVDLTPGNITALSFSHKSTTNKLTPSSLRLAVGRSNGNIEIWNPRNDWFQELIIQGGKDRSIEGLCWYNVPGEPLRLFSIGGSTMVTEWNLATGLPLKNYDCNAGVIWSLAINESQDKLAVGCDNGTVVVIDISGGPGSLEHDTILMRQEARVLSLAWNKDDFVIGGCSDGRIRIWNVQKTTTTTTTATEHRGRLLHTMKVDKAKRESTLVWCVIYLPHTNQIVSGDSTGSVKFWDFQYATLTQSFKSHEADVLCLTTDASNTHVFTAGVDRKIFQFSQNSSSNQLSGKDSNAIKWVNASNRLFHGNDVRALCSYQSKGADFLVSGGIEKSLVISSLLSFSDGNYKKMPVVVPYMKNILINKAKRLVVMWHESIIKIWTIGEDINSEKNYKLVCKLTLKDDQNINTCALSPDGEVLIVGRPSTTKLFHLQTMLNKLKVTKLDNDYLLKTGTKFVKFIDNSKMVMCSTDDEIFSLDLEADNDEDPEIFELPDLQTTKSSIKIPYINKVNHLDVSTTHAVVSRTCGAVDVVDLTTGKSTPIVRLMNFITAVSFNIKRNTTIVVTAENKIYEFNNPATQTEEDGTLLTQWSKNNTENLPKQIKNLKEKCLGIFIEENNADKVWFWGSTWVSRFDFSIDLPINKRRKVKKHTRDGLTVTDGSNFMNDDEEDEDVDMDLEYSENLSHLLELEPRIKSNGGNKHDQNAFFITDKYKPLLFAGLLSDNELIVVERPTIMLAGQPKAFNLPKLMF